jgi:hypothetical protein
MIPLRLRYMLLIEGAVIRRKYVLIIAGVLRRPFWDRDSVRAAYLMRETMEYRVGNTV